MKTIIALITSSLLAFGFTGGIKSNQSDKLQDKYCAYLNKGTIQVVHDGNPLTADVTLSNGAQVKTDGSILLADGTKLFLKVGECADNEGKIIKDEGPKMKDNGYKKYPDPKY